MSWLSEAWDSMTGATQRNAAQDALNYQNSVNKQTLDATQQANKDQLNVQKVLAWLGMIQGNQANAQQLAAALSNQQNSVNMATQLYNQQQQNSLPVQAAQLAGLQAMTPLMQLTGMQGYQMPTSINTTPLQAPNLLDQFTSLSNLFQKQSESNMDPGYVLRALSNPELFLKQGELAAGGSSPTTTSAPTTTTAPVATQPTNGTPGTLGNPGTPATGNNWQGIQPPVYTGPTPTGFQPGLYTAPNGTSMYMNSPADINKFERVTGTPFAQATAVSSAPRANIVSAPPPTAPAAPVTQAPQAGNIKVPPGASDWEVYQTLNNASQAMGDGPTQYKPASAPTQQDINLIASTLTQAPQTQTYNLQAAAGPTASIDNNPIYQFRLQQAQRELANQMSGRGLAGGGAQTRAATDLAMRLSGEEADKQYQRYMNLVQLGMGMQPTQNSTAQSSLSNAYSSGGQNTANALQNAAQNRSGLYSNLGNAYNQASQANANALGQYNTANMNAYGGYQQNMMNSGSTLSNLINFGKSAVGLYNGMAGAGLFGLQNAPAWGG